MKLINRSLKLFIAYAGIPLIPVVSVCGQSLPENIAGYFHYRSIGPTRQAGRIVDIAVPSQLPYTFYIASGNGGLWKTENNGTTFIPVFDRENTLAIGDIAVDPSDPETIWVGTGEPNNSTTDPYATYWGDGVYKSTDGGQTWKNMGLEDSHYIGRIVVHPENSDIVYVAVMGHLYSENSERGVFKTTDGGKTWVKSLDVTSEGRAIGTIDLIINPQNPDIVYTATFDRYAVPWMYYEQGPGSGIYKTTNGGTTWRRLRNGLPEGPLSRIGLTLFPSDPRILYASILKGISHDGNEIDNFIYRSNDGGELWHLTTEMGKPVPGYSYFGQIRVDPNDADHVYVLCFETIHSTDGGKTWSRGIEYGGDPHALWIDPKDSNHMLFGYDYGMAVTYDRGRAWYHPDMLPLAQLYEIGVDMDYPYNVYGGMQDFGTWKGPSTKKGRFPIRLEDWNHILGGDGYYCQVDPTNSRWVYVESQNGELMRIDQKTGQRRGIRYSGRSNLRFNFSTPILISPHNSDVIYHAAQYLLRSSFRGESWEVVSPDLTTNNPDLRDVGPLAYCTITTIDESPVQQGVIWVGTDDGNVQLTTDGGETWTLLNEHISGHPAYWVSRVVASEHDSGTAYVTFTGRRADDFRPFIFKTADYGRTWNSLTNNLPNDEPVNVIRQDHKNPDLLFVGTEKAVHVSIDGGKTWTRFQNDMPVLGIQDLVIHPRENDLVVGTHGRGFFITDISPLQELTSKVLEKEVYLFDIEPKIQWVMPSQNTVAAQNFEGENEPHGVMINYYLKKSIPAGVSILVYDGYNLINELKGQGKAGLNGVMWGMTKRGRKRTPEEIAGYDREVATGAIEPFYDYYDTNEYFGDPDEEVGITGLSLRTRVQRGPGMRGREYVLKRVQPGEYTIVLKAGKIVRKEKSVIMQDHWYDKTY